MALDNRVYWDTLEEQPNGGVVVTFAAPDLEAAAGMVLRFGFAASIEEPQALLELVRKRAREIADHFDRAAPQTE